MVRGGGAVPGRAPSTVGHRAAGAAFYRSSHHRRPDPTPRRITFREGPVQEALHVRAAPPHLAAAPACRDRG